MRFLKRNLTNKNVLIPLILILTLGAILRFYGLENQSLWFDEIGTWKMSNQENLTGVINTVTCCDFHPPGYHLFIYFVEKYIGDSESILRFPSAVSGVLSIFIIFLLAQRLYSYKEGLIAAALMAVLWCPIYYSQEARSYSMLILFTLLATYFWISILRRLNEKARLSYFTIFGYIITAIMSSYLHYFGLYLVALQGLGAILFFIRRRPALFYILLIYFSIFLAYLPWLPAMREHLNIESIWIKSPEFNAFLKNYIGFLFNKSRTLGLVVLTLYSFLLLRSLYNIFKTKEYKNMRTMLLSPGFLLLLWLIVPFVGVYIKSILSTPVLTYRNLIISLPAAYLLLARSITQLPLISRNHAIITFAISGLLLSHLVFSMNYYSKPHKAQFREVANYIVERDYLYKDSIIAASNPYVMNYNFERKGFDRRVELKGRQKHISGIAKVISTGSPRYIWSIHAYKGPDKEYIDFLNKNLTLIEHKKFIRADVWFFENRSPADFYYLDFHSPEEWSTGRYRWSRSEGIISLARTGAVELTFHVSHPDVEKVPVILTLFLNKKPIDKVTFTRKGRISKKYYIPKASEDVQQLFLKISRVWNPYKYGVSKDKRDLGVAVSEIKFLDELPKDGIGFYHRETWGGGQIPGWPHDLPKRFRWTGMRASMRVKSGLKNGITLFLLSSHPDINKNPVRVEIIGDDRLIREEMFIDNKWKKVLLKDDELRDSKVLTFQVSRTWNPEFVGVSKDSRELGIAVAIPEE